MTGLTECKPEAREDISALYQQGISLKTISAEDKENLEIFKESADDFLDN